MRRVVWLEELKPNTFPDVADALDEPNGLLAAGGDLSPARLLSAYSKGIFPWYSHGQPILWWSPDPRAVLFPQRFRLTRSLRKRTRHAGFTVTLDTAFTAVMQACAEPREDQPGTWISDDMIAAYTNLHRLGYAHSVEAWEGHRLVGGLYGVALGAAFFGESMFSRSRDASKIALLWLSRQLLCWGYRFIDCQLSSAHLESLGAESISRTEFIRYLRGALQQPATPAPWTFDPDFDPLQVSPEDCAL